MLCPSFATILLNTYREPSELLVECQVLWSEEGTTQGDPLAMPICMPLLQFPSLTNLQACRTLLGCGMRMMPLLLGAYLLFVLGGITSSLWVLPLATMLMLVKLGLLQRNNIYKEHTDVQITSRGWSYLGAPIGSDEFITEFVSEKVRNGLINYFQELLLILTICCNLWKGSFSLGFYLLGRVGLLQKLLNTTCLYYLHALVCWGSSTPPPAPQVSFVSLSRSLLPSPTWSYSTDLITHQLPLLAAQLTVCKAACQQGEIRSHQIS